MKALRVLGVALAVVLVGAAPPRTPLYGFTSESSDRERQVESMFLDIPSAQGALDAVTAIGAKPHYPGTLGDRDLALYMRDQLRSFGFDADIETFTARVDTPRRLVLALYPTGTPSSQAAAEPTAEPEGRPQAAPPRRGFLRPAARPARNRRSPPAEGLPLAETADDDALPAGPSAEGGEDEAGAAAAGLPFNAGSADGNVTAPLVYAGRGLAGDYEQLAGHGVAVKGAVVLVRYGAAFRGTLARRAQQHGALGVVFYNDPADDGFARGPVYPHGPWRPLTAVERGWVGDGITIPVLPISATNAQLLLRSLRGPAGGPDWSGALDTAYPYARGPGVVHLIVQLNRRTTTLWNTVGRIRGQRGEQQVVLGAHRDAWAFGIGDNGSGIAALLEVARGFGYLRQTGWRPARTIVVAGWDGEEIGTLGSAAYVTRHRAELLAGGVAYLNADEVAIGPTFTADAAAALGPGVAAVTDLVTDPGNARRSIYDAWRASQGAGGAGGSLTAAPSGGSDQVPFLFSLGTPSANMAFTGPFGGYHSSFDTLTFAQRISDPNFVRHRAAAQLYGLYALRLANADVVPYTFAAYLAPLRIGLAQAQVRAAAQQLRFDGGSLQAAIDDFAATAARFDALTARAGNPDATARALEAARILDLAVYGPAGGSALFPEVARTVAGADPSGVRLALDQARDAVQRARGLLAGGAR